YWAFPFLLAVAALLLVGMLILWAELPTGRRCAWGKAQVLGSSHGSCGTGGDCLSGSISRCPWSKPVPPVAGSAWSCPPVRFTCALHNPRNQCLSDRDCPRGKQCCRSFCGTSCQSPRPGWRGDCGQMSGLG
uniref:WAP domain-containing protein n=1 Tax=Catharus ustulatus TaxID=91951 RepID=A0A8C3Y488_CATUS